MTPLALHRTELCDRAVSTITSDAVALGKALRGHAIEVALRMFSADVFVSGVSAVRLVFHRNAAISRVCIVYVG